MSNTWPGGHRHAMTQSEHEEWNRANYPGTLQLCSECGDPTGRCEHDGLFTENGEGPLCERCYTANQTSMAPETRHCPECHRDWTPEPGALSSTLCVSCHNAALACTPTEGVRRERVEAAADAERGVR